MALFVVNRSQTDNIDLDIHFDDAKIISIKGVDTLTGSDPKASNSWEAPHAVEPVPGKADIDDDGNAMLHISPLSFTALRAVIKKK